MQTQRMLAWALRAGLAALIGLVVAGVSRAQAAAPYAYIPNSGNDTVSVVDTAINTVVATVPVGDFPSGIAVTPEGAFVYVTNYKDNTVSVIDTTINTVIATVPAGESPYGIAVRPDGAFVYAANYDAGTLTVIATATKTVVATVTVGYGPRDIAFTPDGASPTCRTASAAPCPLLTPLLMRSSPRCRSDRLLLASP